MNADIKQKWVEALRSGEYEQAVNFLKIERDGGYRYCCLGVLCDIYSRETGKSWQDAPPSLLKMSSHVDGDNEREWVCPPDPVEAWADIDFFEAQVTTRLEGYLEQRDLAELNDRGISFIRIADIIEEQL